MLKLPFALILCLNAVLAIVACSAEYAEDSTPDELGTVEQALCPADVICPGTPAYSWSSGTNIACQYFPGGIVYKPKPAGCQQCCPKWGACTPGGCGGFHNTNIWACRTGGSCSP